MYVGYKLLDLGKYACRQKVNFFQCFIKLSVLTRKFPHLYYTAQNTEILRNFMECEFCGNAQFPYCFWRLSRNSVETVRFHLISAPGN